MGRMSRFLRLSAFLSVLFFATNVFAAGYTCPSYKKYTSCNSGYYMVGSSSSTTYNGTAVAGNACIACSSAGSSCTCSGGTAAPVCSVTVTFKSGSTTLGTQSFTPGTAQKLTAVSNFSAPVLSTYGWSFAGWATSANSTTIAYTDAASATISSATTLYGVWKRTVRFYYYSSATSTSRTYVDRTQYYRNSAASVAGVTSVTTPALTTQTTYGWAPYGWVRGSTTSTSRYSSSTTAVSVSPSAGASQYLYALYTRTATLAYNGNSSTGGSTTSTTGTQYYNTGNTSSAIALSLTLATNGFTRTGYSFSKWAAGSTSGTQYAAGASFAFPNTAWASGKSYSMYAIWTANTYNCSAGQYLNGTTCTTCEKGYYCPSVSKTYTYNGGVQGRTQCTFGTYSDTTGATSCKNIEAGCFGTGLGNTTACPQKCSDQTHSSTDVDMTDFTSAPGAYSVDHCFLSVSGGEIYDAVNNEFLECPAGYVCTGGNFYASEYPQTIEVSGYSSDYYANISSCPSSHPYSDEGISNDDFCYNTNCGTGYNGRNYYENNEPSTCTGNKYTVSFNANGGSGGQTANVTATYASNMPSISTTAPTRTGYTFKGWYDAASDGTQYYTAAGASARTWNKTANATLYAQWTPNVYKITLNNGTGSTPATQDIYLKYNTGWYSDAAATQAITKVTGPTSVPLYYWENFRFKGYLDTQGSLVIPADGTLPGKTAFAQNTELNLNLALSRTLTLNNNGGTGTGSVVLEYNEDDLNPAEFVLKNASGQQLSSMPIPTRSGYTFAGYEMYSCLYTTSYNCSSSVSGWKEVVAANGSISVAVLATINSNLDGQYQGGLSDNSAKYTLRAKWTPNCNAITLNANGGTAGVLQRCIKRLVLARGTLTAVVRQPTLQQLTLYQHVLAIRSVGSIVRICRM